jgi:hypothetical protein
VAATCCASVARLYASLARASSRCTDVSLERPPADGGLVGLGFEKGTARLAPKNRQRWRLRPRCRASAEKQSLVLPL